MTIIDADRQWFKASYSLPGVTATTRDVSFCGHAIAHGDDFFEVPDALLEPRFADNPQVTGPPHVRFYAGATLVLPGGHKIGALCVADHQPNHLRAAQRDALRALARPGSCLARPQPAHPRGR